MSNTKQVVALAGLGSFGFHILDAIKASATWTPIVLTRKGSDPARLARYTDDVTVEQVDYENVDELADVLRKHNVQTLVSTLAILYDPPAHTRVQLNMIAASEKAGVKRFVPTEWVPDFEGNTFHPKFYQPKFAVREALAKSKLEYTLVCVGVFTEYLLPAGTKKPLNDFPLPVNPEKRTARIPGTGDAKFTLTSAYDVARGVVWLLEKPLGTWTKWTHIGGTHASWNEILRECEDFFGEKFAVEYVPEEQIKANIAAVDESQRFPHFLAEIQLSWAIGADQPEGEWEKVTKDKVTVRQVLEKGYSKK